MGWREKLQRQEVLEALDLQPAGSKMSRDWLKPASPPSSTAKPYWSESHTCPSSTQERTGVTGLGGSFSQTAGSVGTELREYRDEAHGKGTPFIPKSTWKQAAETPVELPAHPVPCLVWCGGLLRAWAQHISHGLPRSVLLHRGAVEDHAEIHRVQHAQPRHGQANDRGQDLWGAPLPHRDDQILQRWAGDDPRAAQARVCHSCSTSHSFSHPAPAAGEPFSLPSFNCAPINVTFIMLFGDRFDYKDPTFLTLLRLIDEVMILLGSPNLNVSNLFVPQISNFFLCWQVSHTNRRIYFSSFQMFRTSQYT